MSSDKDAQIHKLTEGSFLFCCGQGNVLFGCPPEILKRILAAHLPMPDTVVVPQKLHHFHSSQASLEFPLYHFLFVQRGLERKRKFQVVANAAQCGGLEKLLRVTVVGPDTQEMTHAGMPADLAEDIYRETLFLSLKHPEGGQPYEIAEMINFHPLELGERCELYPARGRLPNVLLERSGEAEFRLLYGEESFHLDLTVTSAQTPNYQIKHRPLDRSKGGFRITILGRSNGFDPNDPANGYLLNIDGRVVVWDCPAYLNEHLSKLKLDFGDVEALILSHVHEDHIDVIESLRDPPLELYTTPEIYFSLLVKLSSMFDCSIEEAKRYHNWHPIKTRKSMEICGAGFEFFYSVHAIPALGCRIEAKVNGKSGLLHISGDHLSNAALDSMREGGGISERRFEEITSILKGGESLILMDAGGGAIHGDFHDYLDGSGRIGFMHTGLIQEELPERMELVESGQVLDVI